MSESAPQPSNEIGSATDNDDIGKDVGVAKVVAADNENAGGGDRTPVVEFKNVTKTYNAGSANAFTAIKDVSFVVHPKRANSSVCLALVAVVRARS
jgi:hypothetical protein